MIAFTYLLLGAALFATPNLTKRRLFFSVPVPADLRKSEQGRRSLVFFRTLVGSGALALFLVVLFCPASILNNVAMAGPTLLIVIAALAFASQRSRTLPFAEEPTSAREAELSTLPDKLPWFAPFGVGPLMILAITAAFLHENWHYIPMNFPVHWGANGMPDRWAGRTVRGVYGPLLFGAELCSWTLITAFAGWFGARRSRLPRPVFGVMIAIEFLLGFLFSAIAINPLLHLPIWIFVFGPVLFLLVALFVTVRKASECDEPPEGTPNECWYAGLFYFNIEDAALMVEKRDGLGYTFNLANRMSWVLLAGLTLILVSSVVAL